METSVKTLLDQGDKLFSKRQRLMTLWQEIADNFYPERADFTVSRTLGDEFAANLETSYPIIARRDLGNSFSAMLRPTNQDWFKITTSREDRLDSEGKEWLEWASGTQRRAMYDRKANFNRATKEGDHDFGTFGQTVISVDFAAKDMHLLYRCWHLRDVAWCENAYGQIDTIFRKWKPFAIDLTRLFKNVHEKVRKCLEKEPFKEIDVRHIVVPADQYKTDFNWSHPYVSLYVDVDNKYVMEEIAVPSLGYVLPRFQTVSGSQYAYSPATVAALPDARLIQAMTGVLLEAGEKATNPPMLAVEEAIRSDVSIFPGGITWVDKAYDERLGEVLRPLTNDKSGIPLGVDMRRDAAAMIHEAFYLNKLTLPQMSGDMTAFEVGQRVQEYIRQALPLFEPMEQDYNGAICDNTFETLLRWGAFGSPRDIPESLRGAEIQFKFESPLHEAVERQKGQKFLESKQMLAEAAAVDPSTVQHLDIHEAFRDVLESIGTPAKWMVDEREAYAAVKQQKAQEAEQQLMANLQQGAETTETLGNANKSFAEVQ